MLYIDLDNELSITAGCNPNEQIKVYINNGIIHRAENGNYLVKPANPGKARVNVLVNGKSYEYVFTVKEMPDIVPKIGPYNGGRVPLEIFKEHKYIYADIPNFAFEGIHYEIKGYTFYAIGPGLKDPVVKFVTGGSLESVQDLIKKFAPGTNVIFDETKAMGPDNMTRKLPTIAFELY